MKQRGFTLIELLIVIAIVGIIFTLVYTNIVGAKKNRDRIEDLHQRWVANCVEERKKIDAYEDSYAAAEKCELKWATEVLPKLEDAKNPDVVVVPVSY